MSKKKKSIREFLSGWPHTIHGMEYEDFLDPKKMYRGNTISQVKKLALMVECKDKLQTSKRAKASGRRGRRKTKWVICHITVYLKIQ